MFVQFGDLRLGKKFRWFKDDKIPKVKTKEYKLDDGQRINLIFTKSSIAGNGGFAYDDMEVWVKG